MLRAILDKQSKGRYVPGQHTLNLFKGILGEAKNGEARRARTYGVKNEAVQKNSIVKIATQTQAQYYRDRGVFNNKRTVEKELMKDIQKIKSSGALGVMPHDDGPHAPVEPREPEPGPLPPPPPPRRVPNIAPPRQQP